MKRRALLWVCAGALLAMAGACQGWPSAADAGASPPQVAGAAPGSRLPPAFDRRFHP